MVEVVRETHTGGELDERAALPYEEKRKVLVIVGHSFFLWGGNRGKKKQAMQPFLAACEGDRFKSVLGAARDGFTGESARVSESR